MHAAAPSMRARTQPRSGPASVRSHFPIASRAPVPLADTSIGAGGDASAAHEALLLCTGTVSGAKVAARSVTGAERTLTSSSGLAEPVDAS